MKNDGVVDLKDQYTLNINVVNEIDKRLCC